MINTILLLLPPVWRCFKITSRQSSTLSTLHLKNKICLPDLSMSPKRVKEVEDMNDEVRRLKINERERRRMHDLNSAMDGLRSAMPYARG